MKPEVVIRLMALVALVVALAGCVARPPTIAHVHIGHALTGVHVTPNHEAILFRPRSVPSGRSTPRRRASEHGSCREAEVRAHCGQGDGLRGRLRREAGAHDGSEPHRLRCNV